MSIWSWFLKLIGISPDVMMHLARAELAWQRPGMLWGGLAFMIPTAWFIYRRQAANLPTVSLRWRVMLTATRVVTLLMLITILSGPYLRIDHRYERKPIFAVLFDHSHSMNLPAGPFESDEERSHALAGLGVDPSQEMDAAAEQLLNDMSRAALAHATFRANRVELMKVLSDDFDLHYYSFGRQAEPIVDQFEQDKTGETTADKPATHIATAVNDVLDDAAGQPVAGIMIISDGQNTGGAPPSEAIAAAQRSQTSLFPVAVGSRMQLQDLAIVDVFTSGEVAVGDTVRVAVTIESKGFDGRTITVELREGESTLDAKELTLSASEQQQIELVFVAGEPGLRYLDVVVPPFPEESETLRANNADVAVVRVSDEKLKLLLIDGLPRWDFRFLKNALRRDHGLAGSTSDAVEILLEAEWRRLASGEQKARREQVVNSLADYHAVIVGDVSTVLLDVNFQQRLNEAVSRQGLGLIVAAGPNHMPHEFDSSFQDLLPLQLESKSAGVEAPAYKPFKIEITPAGSIHEAMRLYDDPARNESVWSRMPPFYWTATAERPAPAATVLAWNPSIENGFGKMPLIAHHYAGAGRVAFVGTDSTWAWRQNVGDRYFYRFWGQMIRFVARRPEKGKSKSNSLEVRPLRSQPGEEAEVELFAYHADGSPRIEGRLEATAIGPTSQTTIELVTDVAHKGRYVGRYSPTEIGEHRLVYQPDTTTQPVEGRLQVIASTVEWRDPNVNRALLEHLAQATGGKLLELDELADVAPLLSAEPQWVEIHREATLWDNWLMLLALVLVYSADVGIRRMTGLS